MPDKTDKRASGFTLVEILAVIAIIGILAAIAIPMYSNYRIKAFNAAAKSDVMNFKVVMEAYQTVNDGYPLL